MPIVRTFDERRIGAFWTRVATVFLGSGLLASGCGGSSGGNGGPLPLPDLRAVIGSVLVPSEIASTAAGSPVNLFELTDGGAVGPIASAVVADDSSYEFRDLEVAPEVPLSVVVEVLEQLTGGRLAAEAPAVSLGAVVVPGAERTDVSGVTEVARVALEQALLAGALTAGDVGAARVANLELGAATLVDALDLADPIAVAMAAARVREITSDGATEPVVEPPPPGECGNGEIEIDEECDDGAANIEPGTCAAGEECCTNICTLEAVPAPECGNGIEEEGEECDDGEDNVDRDECAPGETCCTLRCAIFEAPEPPPPPPPPPPPVCGNGVLEGNEQCDQGAENVAPGVCVTLELPACCTTDCLIEVVPGCGNFLVEPERDEQCDEGPNGGPNCCPDCTLRTTEGLCARGA